MSSAIDSLLGSLRGRRFAVLTGAGCSTESGIPDYRGPTGSLRERRPIQYLEFVRDAQARRLYWARSVVGWRTFSQARPNAAHRALAALARAGHVTGLITQNVDGLHRAAGSDPHVELHGSLHRVVCMSCSARMSRAHLQDELLARNPECAAWTAELAPDGDAELDAQLAARLVVPDCPRCGGVLKPDVVFFGENVPTRVVEEAWRQLDGAEGMLVVGSSLTAYSGYRFVLGAAERGMAIAIVNQGPTRADELAAVRVDASAGEVVTQLAARLC